MSKETIIKCEKQKPRFHAFLKVMCVSLKKKKSLRIISEGVHLNNAFSKNLSI